MCDLHDKITQIFDEKKPLGELITEILFIMTSLLSENCLLPEVFLKRMDETLSRRILTIFYRVLNQAFVHKMDGTVVYHVLCALNALFGLQTEEQKKAYNI